MNMTFADAPTAPETSLQRRERLKKEGLKRGRVPSKAELAALERERREEGLSRSLIPGQSSSSSSALTSSASASAAGNAAAAAAKKSKGLAMMAKMGFTPGAKLGAGGDGARTEPLRIEVREDRGGIGLEGEKKRKLREAAEALGVDVAAEGSKRPRVDEGDYRERMARERDAARKEKLVRAAQGIAERMDEDREEAEAEASSIAGRRKGYSGGDEDEDEDERKEEEEEEDEKKRERAKKARRTTSSRPLKSVPVLYRVLVRRREEAERDRRMRHDLEVSAGTLSAKLPTYEDEGMDADDKFAVGREDKKTVYVAADDLDEEDPELDEFEALEVDERLKRLVAYLRGQYRYCFWCKFAYPDEEMEGCPGTTEEDHD